MESRTAYGYGGTGVTKKATRQRWLVAYRTDDGDFGIDSTTFSTEEEATEYGKQYQREHSWVKEFWVQHPAKTYSAY